MIPTLRAMHPFPGEPEYEFLSSHLEQIEGVQERLFGEARRLKHQVCHGGLGGTHFGCFGKAPSTQGCARPTKEDELACAHSEVDWRGPWLLGPSSSEKESGEWD